MFGKLAVPRRFEFVVEEVLYIFGGNGVQGATAWWHLRWILDGEPEEAFHAPVTHTMSAFEFMCLCGGVLFTARVALDTNLR